MGLARRSVGNLVDDGLVPGLFRYFQWRETMMVFDIGLCTVDEQQVDAFTIFDGDGIV